MIKQAEIEDLAYLIKEAKKHIQEKPIVFLGAGASKSGGIPLADEIVEYILEHYKDKPNIRRYVSNSGEKDYAKLMDLLEPHERNSLLKKYIDDAKINVTHIYLAQLINEGLVDYILTVNFDNLILRALALYNEFLPTYDMAILKDLTTTNFKEKSIVYLHGQSHGLWLLNTEEELKKVEKVISPILHTIKNRPWIIIGYSGNDPIFDHIIKLGRFDKGLYWVAYQQQNPNGKVCEFLLEKENTNSFLIKGHDSDSFMIELCRQLKLPQPQILEKPFSVLSKYLDNIIDIDDKEHFKAVKERLDIAKKQVARAVGHFEENLIENIEETQDEIQVDKLKKEIIDEILKQEFNPEKISVLEQKAQALNEESINYSLASLFDDWGETLLDLAKAKGGDEGLYWQSLEKYETAARLNPKDDSVFYNYGIALLYLAKVKGGDEGLYRQSLEKFQKSLELGGRVYNLACAFALLNNKSDALKYLAIALKNKEIKKEFALADDDFNSLRQNDDFIKLIDSFND